MPIKINEHGPDCIKKITDCMINIFYLLGRSSISLQSRNWKRQYRTVLGATVVTAGLLKTTFIDHAQTLIQKTSASKSDKIHGLDEGINSSRIKAGNPVS